MDFGCSRCADRVNGKRSLLQHIRRLCKGNPDESPECEDNSQEENALKNPDDAQHEDYDKIFLLRIWDPGGLNLRVHLDD